MGLFKRGGVLAVLLGLFLIVPGCVLYSSSQGVANADGFVIKFTIHANLSQAQAGIYFNTCNDNFDCYTTTIHSVTSDVIGDTAVSDCDPNAIPTKATCGTSEIPALWGRAFTAPAYQSNRCLGFEVAPSFPDIWNESGAKYIYSTWFWVNQGSWSCS